MTHEISRRNLITGIAAVAGAAAAAPLLAACGSAASKAPAVTGADELKKALPNYVPSQAVSPDIAPVPGVHGTASDPVFLRYPSNPVETVKGIPGSGGTYTTRTPLWGSIPPSSGNSYYDAVNKALGATVKLQPIDGNNYTDGIPALFASGNLPDWIQIPGWMNTSLNLGSALDHFVDLTPYLSGDRIAKYPNLANIPSPAWQSGVWNGKLYGLPSFASSGNFPGYIFYRKDLFEAAGVSPEIKSADDMFNIGKQLTNAAKGQWAYDDMWPYLKFPFGCYGQWMTDPSGKIINQYEAPGMVEALNCAAKLAKAGFVHPDAMASNTQQGQQRFWSGKVAIQGGGLGSWDGDDAKGGAAANPKYNRQAFRVFSGLGGTPVMELSTGASWFSYLNKKLSDKQIQECLAIANYFAAPYGSKEYLTVNFGAEGIDYTMKDGNPLLTDKGQKEVASTYVFLISPPQVQTVKNGNTQVVKDWSAWQQDAVKYAAKPLFYGMNIAEPPQFASLGRQVEDMVTDIRFGRKPVEELKTTMDAWRKQGGDQLRSFYEDIRTKYGTGQ